MCLVNLNLNYVIIWGLGIGDWGLPNPQSPIPNPHKNNSKIN